MDQIADCLNEVLTTAVEGSRSGGMTDASLAVDTLSVNEVFNPLRMIFAQEASKKGLALRMRHSDLSIASDRVLIIRILSNLISNAVKYTDDGAIVVARRPCRGGHKFQVWDTGAGIDTRDLQRLLNPETGPLRLDPDSAAGSGSGFGINHSLAARIGGRIEGRSVPGRGSVFELILPVSEVPEDALQRVLLLDDDVRQRHVSAAALRGLCPAARVSEQAEIEPWLAGVTPGERNLLILDQHFGGGAKVIDRLSSATDHDLRVIVTTYDRSIEARTRLTAFADLILYKPVSEQAPASPSTGCAIMDPAV
jgi:anti-sigma regulatory factor (Ser/Thr protein kinase)